VLLCRNGDSSQLGAARGYHAKLLRTIYGPILASAAIGGD
jgi:hypothetical protein